MSVCMRSKRSESDGSDDEMAEVRRESKLTGSQKVFSLKLKESEKFCLSTAPPDDTITFGFEQTIIPTF